MVLGLDIGIASCGWALIDDANNKIIDIGVHLWDAPQKEKTSESLAKVRRSARSTRRNTKRHANRLKNCFDLFKKYGLAPQDADKTWRQTVKGDPRPLQSRVTALDSLIKDRHFAQVLYNICTRRGYIPHGEEDSDKDTEGRRVLTALKENEDLMIENGWRTVGERYKGVPTGPTARPRLFKCLERVVGVEVVVVVPLGVLFVCHPLQGVDAPLAFGVFFDDAASPVHLGDLLALKLRFALLSLVFHGCCIVYCALEEGVCIGGLCFNQRLEVDCFAYLCVCCHDSVINLLFFFFKPSHDIVCIDFPAYVGPVSPESPNL